MSMFADLPRGRFGCILADPPWAFKSYTALTKANEKIRRDVEKHYPTMSLADIKALPVREVAARDAHLWLWTTGPFLPKAFEVIEAWGFRYSGSGLVWIKLKKSHEKQLKLLSSEDMERELAVGLGYTTRKNAEFCLLARRGNARRIDKSIREIVLSPLREHSRKPEVQYNRIERYCDGPRLEMFARNVRLGWHQWGNDTRKFESPVILRAAA